MTRHIGCLVAILGLTYGAPDALAHGSQYVAVNGAAAVKFLYDDQSPMAFSDVSVFAPEGDAEPFLTGTADVNGHFAFVPDRGGGWRIVADDGMGHLVSASIDVNDDGLPQVVGPRLVGRLPASVVGVGVILGVFGIVSLATRRFGMRAVPSREGGGGDDAHC